MGNVRLLSLDDLYSFYVSQGKSLHFNAEEEHTNIVVQLPATLKFEKSDRDTEGLRPVVLQACHTGENNNHSYISEKAMKSALPSFSNRPILGYIHEVDGQPEFYTHCMHLDEDDNVVYDEIPIGIIPESCNAKLKYDSEKDKTYCVVNGYIYEEYSPKAVEILERENECSCSVELSVRELSYDSSSKVLCIDDYFYSGVTILGKTPDGDEVKPGMSGANIKLADFSEENNSFVFDSKLVNEIADAVAQRLSDINNQGKEEDAVDFEENVETVAEEVAEEVVETEVMSEETEATEEEVKVVEEETSEEVDEEPAEETPNVVEDFADDDPEEEEEPEEEEPEEAVIDDDTLPAKKKYSVNGMEFELSLSEIQSALMELVNSTYSESDNDYYGCEVYQDSKTVVMIGMWSGKAYKQGYKVRGGVYSLVGDRVAVKPVFVTADEEAELDKMRNNYSEISEKLAKYESEPEKMEILNSDDYSQIANSEEFAALKDVEKHFDMTVEEVRKAADDMLLAYAKNNKLEFAAQPENKSVGVKNYGSKANKKTGRYGNLFKK